MKSRSRKDKGVRLQNWTRDLLLSLADNLSPDDIKCAIMGENAEDIKLSSSARVVLPVSIECKNQERLNVWSAIDQAEENAGEYEPVVVFKKNRRDPRVIVDAEFFFKLLIQASASGCEPCTADRLCQGGKTSSKGSGKTKA